VVSEPWLYVIVAGGAIAIVLFTLYATKGRKRVEEENLREVVETRENWLPPLKPHHTVTRDEAKSAKKDLKMLELEREILSYAIRRLYEAQAEGRISEEERENLAQDYKNRMMKIRDSISKSESVVALHELEAMQEDLVKLFSERFDELGKKVEDLRTRLEVEPIKEMPIPAPAAKALTPPAKEKRRVHKRPSTPRKTEAEKRIEEIRAEVEKVLERLEQIEVES
jgi:phage/plasmid-associated DNA primase